MIKNYSDRERGNPEVWCVCRSVSQFGQATVSVQISDFLVRFSRSEMLLRGKSVRSWCDGSLDPSFVVDPLSYFLFHPVLHDWCNKGHGMCYLVCGMVHIKEPLLLIGKYSLCGGSGFPFSLSEWPLTISLTPYNRR